jgi:hypothetical protein
MNSEQGEDVQRSQVPRFPRARGIPDVVVIHVKHIKLHGIIVYTFFKPSGEVELDLRDVDRVGNGLPKPRGGYQHEAS